MTGISRVLAWLAIPKMKTFLSLLSLLTLAGLLATAGCASDEHGQGGSYDSMEYTNNVDRGGYWDHGYYYPY